MSHADSFLRIKPDGRTTEARVAREFRAELVARLAGPPDDVQALVIDEAVRLRIAPLRDGGNSTIDRLIRMRVLLGIASGAA